MLFILVVFKFFNLFAYPLNQTGTNLREIHHFTEKLLLEFSQSKQHTFVNLKKKPIVFHLGDKKNFHTRDLAKEESWKTREFELRYQSETVRIWFDVVDFSYVTAKQTEVQLIAQLSEYVNQHTSSHSIAPNKGIVELMTHHYGAIPDPDSDGHMDILLLNILEPPGVSGTIAGYFDPVDLTDHEKSNQADVLYIDIYPLIYKSPNSESVSVEQAAGTIAHELQHLILQGYKKNAAENTFINEGLSELAEILCGFEPRTSTAFFDNPNRPLFSWNYSNALPDYSRASAWFHYLYEQIGTNWLPDVVQTEQVGIAYLEKIIKNNGFDLNSVWKQWILSLVKPFSSAVQSPYIDERRQQLSGIQPNDVSDQFSQQSVQAYSFRYNRVPFPVEAQIWSTSTSNLFEKRQDDSQWNQSHQLNKLDRFTLAEPVQGSWEWIQFWETQPDTNAIQAFHVVKTAQEEHIEDAGNAKLTAFALFATYLNLDNQVKKIGMLFPLPEQKVITEIGIHHLFDSEFQHLDVPVTSSRRFNLVLYESNGEQISNRIIQKWENWESSRSIGNAVIEWLPLTNPIQSALADYSHFFIEISSADTLNKINVGMQGNGPYGAWFTQYEWNSTISQNNAFQSLSFFGFPVSEGTVPFIRLKTLQEKTEPRVSIIARRDQNRIHLQIDSDYVVASSVAGMILEYPDGNTQALQFENQSLLEVEPFELLQEGKHTFYVNYYRGSSSFVAKQDWFFPKSNSFVITKTFPNPFNASTQIELQLLSRATSISLQVVDILGRKVQQITQSRVLEPGFQTIPIEMSRYASGLYFFQLEVTDEAQRTERLLTKGVLVK